MDVINYLSSKKIIIVCGHYGSGKTNIAVNLCIMLKEQADLAYTLADLDTVNPYFRSADNIGDLKKRGLDFIVPPYANTNVDIPAIPPEIYSIFSGGARSLLDVGGDDNGATVLGMFADGIKKESHEMIYVANKYRSLTAEPMQAADLALAIEQKSKLKITSLINNSNIGHLTTKKEIESSAGYAQKTAELLKVPLICATSMIDLDFSLKKEYNILMIKNYTKKLF